MRPEHIQVDLGCNGLGLLLLWFIELHRLTVALGFPALGPGLCGSLLLGSASRIFSTLMQWLMSRRFKRIITVPPASFLRGAQLYCEAEGFHRLSSLDAREHLAFRRYSLLSVPRDLAAFGIALMIGYHGRCP